MADADSLTVKALPTDGRAWRIDWMGNLAFPNRMMRRMQPSVLLHFSHLRDDPYDSIGLLSAVSTNAQHQRKCWVSVGSLGLFQVGDIWRNGRIEFRPDYQLEIFNDLLIDSSTTTIVKAGLSPQENGFLLPLEEHPWHRQNTQSYCLAVNLPDDRRMIIPCYELIRFYFGSSSSLLTQFFQPPLKHDRLYTAHKLDNSTKHLQISLASKISGYSAADIGRIACDPIARRAAVVIGTSSLKASVTGQPIYPQAFFSFEGITTLTASGKWLSFGDRANATFIVYSLRSCSHPFPFKSLRYETAASQQSTGRLKEQDSGASETKSRRFRGASKTSDQNLVEQDASGKLAPKTKRIKENVRFPDLLKKPIWKTKPLNEEEFERAASITAATPVDDMAVGEPGSVRRVRPVDLVVAYQAAQQAKVPMPAFLKPIVEHLNNLQGTRVDLLTASEEDGWTIPIPLVGDEDGVIELEAFHIDDCGESRLKRIAFFEVHNEQCKMIVSAVESVIDFCLPNYAIQCCQKSYVTNDEAFRSVIRSLLFLENIRGNGKEISCAVAWSIEDMSRLLTLDRSVKFTL